MRNNVIFSINNINGVIMRPESVEGYKGGQEQDMLNPLTAGTTMIFFIYVLIRLNHSLWE